MEEIGHEGRQDEQITSLQEKVASLETEKEEKERRIQEMEMTIALLVRTTREHAERLAEAESVIADITQHAQQQTAFNENVRASITGLANEIEKHQNNFREVGRIFQKPRGTYEEDRCSVP